ncbi:MAG: trigger factor family protein, partial [bacterium]
MSYSVTPIVSPEGEVRLQLEASSDEVSIRYHKALEDYRRRARIPGFRPGRVPVEVIKQRLGKDLWSEVAENLAKEWFQDAIRREGFTPGGTVRIRIIDFGEDRPLKAEAYFPLKPEVNL